MIGQLALKADSGVPKSAVKEVNIAGRSLAAKFDAIDKAGDSGDLAGTKKEFEEMVKLAEILDNYVPKVFACPMKCEGEKTYPAAGKCPKCGMAITQLKSHADHDAKHGGTFFMAPDNKHHLEGTISAKKEFRIYFYDEYTKPIEPGKFTAEGTAWTSGKDVDKPLKMTVGPKKEFLTGQVDEAIAFPIRVKLFIDFKDKEKPQVFDFEFTEPSKEPADTDKDKEEDKEKKHSHG
ncbi:MAG: hypothetical protein IPK83_20980 [Planctomycetes bacterium]|nr:hypothetical protein [Planctomycetota bacterium]